jgi:3' terminal RNA ribose 2'-O-methyltransferase Hen1
MILTISTQHRPATDLGFLLHKNPARAQAFEMSFGKAHVFYPEAGEERCTAALLLDVDPVGLVRKGRGAEAFALDQYVNDRPYVASSYLSVAIAQVFGSALAGRSKERPELVEVAIPLTARLSAVPCRAGEELIKRLFEPLGYAVRAERHALDENFPEWGEGWYYTLELAATKRLSELLTHLYVLVPVLDNDKHYFVGDEEVEKLLRHGDAWLGAHPERVLIAERYLKHRSHLTREALARLVEESDPDPDATEEAHDREEEMVERPLSLNQQRLGTVLSALKATGARTVLDLGCGEGNLLRELLREKQFERIIGMDVSMRALRIATDRLKIDRMGERERARLELMQGSLMYRDERLKGADAAALVEVIEHMDPPRLAALERVVFEFARPGSVVVTTPNAEYNVKWETLPAGQFRHRDHRFEWTRAEFREWAERVAARHGYGVRFMGIGEEDAVVGSPTQMGVFERADSSHGTVHSSHGDATS